MVKMTNIHSLTIHTHTWPLTRKIIFLWTNDNYGYVTIWELHIIVKIHMYYDIDPNTHVNQVIYYSTDPKTIMKHCRAMFTSRQNFPPKVLDASETMILFNLPRPWILICGKHKRPCEIQIGTYKILNRMELCECSLTAGTFSLDETLVQCTLEICSQADGVFKMSYAINKIIFDYLQVNNDVMLEGDVLKALSELLLQKSQYDWSSVKWHEGTLLPDNVINKKFQGVITELAAVMDYIVSDTEKEAFQDENTFQKAQNDFNTFMQYTK